MRSHLLRRWQRRKREDRSRSIGSSREIQRGGGDHAARAETYRLENKGRIGGDICYRLSQMEQSESDKFLDHISPYLKPQDTSITISELVTQRSTCLLRTCLLPRNPASQLISLTTPLDALPLTFKLNMARATA